MDKNLTINYRMSERNFADNKYIRKDIRLKTAENTKYRAKRIGRARNNKSNKYPQNLLDDYVDVLNLIIDPIIDPIETPSENNIKSNYVDQILQEFEII